MKTKKIMIKMKLKINIKIKKYKIRLVKISRKNLNYLLIHQKPYLLRIFHWTLHKTM